MSSTIVQFPYFTRNFTRDLARGQKCAVLNHRPCEVIPLTGRARKKPARLPSGAAVIRALPQPGKGPAN